jgi:ferritin
MLSKTMQDALNDQINAEYYSSYLYLSMAAWADSANLKGFANWFRMQVQEEMVHVMKFFQYVLDRRGLVKLTAIAGPPTQWASPLAAFEATLAHEQHVTGRINKLAELAIKENDHASHALLEWFVTEQVEEEATADSILQQLKLAGDAPAALFLLDRELGARTFTPPAAGA